MLTEVLMDSVGDGPGKPFESWSGSGQVLLCVA